MDENKNKKLLSAEEQRKEMCEKAWLHYFNRVLFEKGVITEHARNRMTGLIEARNQRETK